MRNVLMLIAASLLLGAGAARAASFPIPLPACGYHPTCTRDPFFGPFANDYSLGTGGMTYRWDLTFTSTDPLARVTLDSPTQVEVDFTYNRGDGIFESSLAPGPVPYRFQEIFAKNRTSYLIRTPANFNTCANSVASASPCAANYIVWGNGTYLRVTGSAPVTVSSSGTLVSSLVAEPRTWALLIAGFGATGVMLRRNRTQCRRLHWSVRRNLVVPTEG